MPRLSNVTTIDLLSFAKALRQGLLSFLVPKLERIEARIDEVSKLEGPPGKPGKPGKPGAPGEPGKPGDHIIGAEINKDGHLILTWNTGVVLNVGRVTGEDGEVPEHRWRGNKLSFQNPDGTWGKEIDLTGPPVNVLRGSGHGGGGGSAGTTEIVQTDVDITLGASNQIVLVDASAGDVTVTLPSAFGRDGDPIITVKRVNVGGGDVIVQAPGSETIDLAPNVVLNTARIGATTGLEFSPVAGNWWVT